MDKTLVASLSSASRVPLGKPSGRLDRMQKPSSRFYIRSNSFDKSLHNQFPHHLYGARTNIVLPLLIIISAHTLLYLNHFDFHKVVGNFWVSNLFDSFCGVTKALPKKLHLQLNPVRFGPSIGLW